MQIVWMAMLPNYFVCGCARRNGEIWDCERTEQ